MSSESYRSELSDNAFQDYNFILSQNSSLANSALENDIMRHGRYQGFVLWVNENGSLRWGVEKNKFPILQMGDAPF